MLVAHFLKAEGPMKKTQQRTTAYPCKDNDHLSIHVGAKVESSVLDAFLILDNHQQCLDGREPGLVHCVVQSAQPKLKIAATVLLSTGDVVRSDCIHGCKQKIWNRVLGVMQASKETRLVQHKEERVYVAEI